MTMKKIILLIGALAAAQTSFAQPAEKLKLEQKDNLLYAHVTITQPEDTAGKITVKWQPPKASRCVDSSYSLNYKNKTYHTQAYRHVMIPDAQNRNYVCAGEWQVQ